MTIYGWDASHYDAVPSGARVVSEGFKFMTHKAGGDKDDAEIAAWWRAMEPYRDDLLLGAYWVLYPGNPIGRANAFLNRLDDTCPGWDAGPFILQLDCELWNGDPSTKPGLSDIRTACNQLKHEHPKLTPIVYASKGQYGNSLTGLGYPLWNARYPTSKGGSASLLYSQVGGDNGSGWEAYSGQTPTIWQFTSSATIAGQTTCDANAYRGTLAELTARLAPGFKQEVPDVELTDKYGDAAYPTRTVQNRLKDDATLRDLLCEAPGGTGQKAALAAIPATSVIRQLAATPAAVASLAAKVDVLTAKVDALDGGLVAIPQAQIDLAILNALKTLAGGQS